MEKYYDVKYRVYNKGVGWTVWAKNDQMSGWSKNGQKTGNGNGRYSGRYIQLMQVKITAKDVKVGKWSPPKTIKPKKTTRYDYQLFILNKYKIYDSDCAILYIKTNNPNPDSFAVTGGGGYVNPPVFEDVKYKDKENQDLRKVEGGYLKWVYNGRESGKKTIRIWEAFKGYSGDDIRFAYEGLRKYYGKEAKTISYFAYSSLTDYESHMKDIIAKSTDSSMSFHEKMGKISEYIFSNYKYYLNTTEYKDGVADMRYVFLLSNYGTWWETKEVDSYVTPFLLEDIAIELGCPKENIVNNYYIDWSRHSEIDVTYDGVTRTYSCCPPPSMNTINLDEIVYFDFSKYRERGLTRKAGWY
jgi:hypothetical protein